MFVSTKPAMTVSPIAVGFLFVCLAAVQHAPAAGVAVGVEFADARGPFTESGGHVGVNWGGSAVPVGPNPQLEPWTKTIVLSSPGTADPNVTTVVEKLRFYPPSSGPFLPVIEWREEILAPGFVWLDGHMEQLELSAVPIRTIATGVPDGSSIVFGFSATPIESNDYLYLVTKRFVWTGVGARPSQIDVREHPAVVPEPSAVASFALALACLAVTRRRNAAFAGGLYARSCPD